MLNNRTVLDDLVCGMSVDSDEISADYQGTRYTFCSEQCLERFQENPKLYTGTQSDASKPGKQDIYEFQIVELAETLPVEVADKLTEHVRAMMGIQYIEIYDGEMEISFDPKQVTLTQIETAITRFGELMGEEWAAILDRAITHPSGAGKSANPGI